MSLQKNLRGVSVSMLIKPTGGTAESTFVSRLFVDVIASRTGNGAVGGIDLDQESPAPSELIAQLLSDCAPASIVDHARQSAARERRDVEIFDHHSPVRLGYRRAETVDKIFALPSHLAVRFGELNSGLFPILGSFRSARHSALCAYYLRARALVMSWVVNERPVGVGNQVSDSEIQGDYWPDARGGLGDFYIADHMREPLINIANQGTGLGFALDRSGQHCAQSSNLGERNVLSNKSPGLPVRLGHPTSLVDFSFPTGLSSLASKKYLPGLVQLDEQVVGDIPRHIRKPWNGFSYFGKFPPLRMYVGAAPFALRTITPDLPLFQRQVPEEPKRGFPFEQALFLRRRRVNSVTECLVAAHARGIARRGSERKIRRDKLSQIATSGNGSWQTWGNP